MTSKKPKKILLLANSELGEANVFLALFPALLKANPDVEVHLASFSRLEKHAKEVSSHVRKTSPRARPFVFHEMQGLPRADGIAELQR
ncbi:hypothetical protein XA68_13270 [Ophiocordyceps unilateralis]|uniref:Lipid-A-disaccharide synthase n=1 Tax=Ophiocordyceps unilateralis TaxID=268505 RepID=A0A2A9PN94_OPHUN|nr:hypothetical protein XA68_13270 [Ophiocordyceps unilateralis]